MILYKKFFEILKNYDTKIFALTFSAMLSSYAFADDIERELQAVAQQTQKNLPTTVADGIVATSMAAIGKTLTMQYRIEIDKNSFKKDKKMQNELHQSSIATQCTNPKIRRLIDQGATIYYRFFDKNTHFLLEIVVDQEKCIRSKM